MLYKSTAKAKAKGKFPPPASRKPLSRFCWNSKLKTTQEFYPHAKFYFNPTTWVVWANSNPVCHGKVCFFVFVFCLTIVIIIIIIVGDEWCLDAHLYAGRSYRSRVTVPSRSDRSASASYNDDWPRPIGCRPVPSEHEWRRRNDVVDWIRPVGTLASPASTSSCYTLRWCRDTYTAVSSACAPPVSRTLSATHSITAAHRHRLLFGHVDMKSESLFEWARHLSTGGYKYKLYRKRSSASARYFFSACRKSMEFATQWSWFQYSEKFYTHY